MYVETESGSRVQRICGYCLHEFWVLVAAYCVTWRGFCSMPAVVASLERGLAGPSLHALSSLAEV